jgi:hypothetical protein
MLSESCQALCFIRSYIGPDPEHLARLMREAGLSLGKPNECTASEVLAWEEGTGDFPPSYYCPYLMTVRWTCEDLFREWARREMPMEIFNSLVSDKDGLVGEKLVIDLMNFLIEDLVKQTT